MKKSRMTWMNDGTAWRIEGILKQFVRMLQMENRFSAHLHDQSEPLRVLRVA